MSATPEVTRDGETGGATSVGLLGPAKASGVQATAGLSTPPGPGYGGAGVSTNSQVNYCRRDLSKQFDQDTTICNLNGEGRDRGNLDAQTKVDIDVTLDNLTFNDTFEDEETDLTMTESIGDNSKEDLETTGKTLDRTWIEPTETETKKKRKTAAEIWKELEGNEKDWTDVLSKEAKRKIREKENTIIDSTNDDTFDFIKGSKRTIGYDRRMRLKRAKFAREQEVNSQDPLHQEVEDLYLNRESFADIVQKKERMMFDVKIRRQYTQEEQKITQEQLDNFDLKLLEEYMEFVKKHGDTFEYDAVAGYSKETGVGWLSVATKEMAEFVINAHKNIEPQEGEDEIDPLEYYIYPVEDRVFRNMWTSIHGKWVRYTQESLTARIMACNNILKYKEEGVTKFFHFKVVEMGKPNQAGFLKIGVQVDERLINVLKNPTIKGRIKLGFSELILHGSNVEREVNRH